MHFIQVAMHVIKMKACKWLPVIIPIKEQLCLGPVGTKAPVLAPHLLLYYLLFSEQAVTVCVGVFLCVIVCVSVCVRCAAPCLCE